MVFSLVLIKRGYRLQFPERYSFHRSYPAAEPSGSRAAAVHRTARQASAEESRPAARTADADGRTAAALHPEHTAGHPADDGHRIVRRRNRPELRPRGVRR